MSREPESDLPGSSVSKSLWANSSPTCRVAVYPRPCGGRPQVRPAGLQCIQEPGVAVIPSDLPGSSVGRAMTEQRGWQWDQDL